MKRETILLVCPNLRRRWEEPPMGLLSVAAVLERAGYPIEVLDLNFDSTWDRYCRTLRQREFRMIGFTALSRYAEDAYEAIRLAKEIAPQATAVLGGPHATALPEDTLRDSEADVLVYGEGELTALDLADAIHRKARLDRIPGLYVRRKGRVVATDPRPFIEDLDDLPVPARHLLPHLPRYIDSLGGSISMFTRRGCPGQCMYCQPVLRKLFGRKVRARSAAKVLDEMQLLRRHYGIDLVQLRDDTFCSRASYLAEFADEYQRRQMRMRWYGQARVNELTEEKATYLKRTRCEALCFGFETGSQRMLDVYRKGATIGQALRAARICKREGILIQAAIMIGGPTETEADAERTIKFVQRIDPEVLDPHIVTPTPGSDLFYLCEQEGLLAEFSLDQLSERASVGVNLSAMDDDTLDRKMDDLWQAYRRSRRLSRAYLRWRIGQMRVVFRNGQYLKLIPLIMLTLIKGNGALFRTAQALGKCPLPFRRVFRKAVWGG